jgi:D-aspartate ligase
VRGILKQQARINRYDLTPKPLDFDVTVPVLVLKIGRYAVHHGTLGIIRSLGRLGVPVYAVVEDCFAPAATSYYLTKAFACDSGDRDAERVLARVTGIGERLGRPTILIPTDDSAAAFVAEHAHKLAKWFLFPRLPGELPRRLSNKKELHFLCRTFGVPCPDNAFPRSVDDVYAFIEHAIFPIMVKAAESQRLPAGARSVSVARNPKELLALYHQAENPDIPNLIFQEYIPDSCAENWIFHGYCNPPTGCLVAFTGKKLRSYPASAGSTTLGVSVRNEPLILQTAKFLAGIGYAGIVDIDYRLDKRTGEYLLLDFNPRIGANFRMFEDDARVDVVRALHLDLTGRRVCRLPVVEGRVFIVEPLDVLASLSHILRRELTLRGWWQSLKGNREMAWFNGHDPLPFLTMCARLLFQGCEHVVRNAGVWLGVRTFGQLVRPRPRSWLRSVLKSLRT